MNSVRKRNLTLSLLAVLTLASAGAYVITENKAQALSAQEQSLMSRLNSERIVLGKDQKTYSAQQKKSSAIPVLQASSEPDVFKSMTQLAGQAHVSIQSISITKSNQGNSQNASATLNVNGTTDELLSFVSLLQNTPDSVSVTAMNLQTTKGPTTMALQITLPIGRHS